MTWSIERHPQIAVFSPLHAIGKRNRYHDACSRSTQTCGCTQRFTRIDHVLERIVEHDEIISPRKLLNLAFLDTEARLSDTRLDERIRSREIVEALRLQRSQQGSLTASHIQDRGFRRNACVTEPIPGIVKIVGTNHGYEITNDVSPMKYVLGTVGTQELA